MSNRKCYFLVYNNAFGSYDDVKALLDAWSDILNWHSLFTGTFFVISEKSVKELTHALIEKKQHVLEKNAIARFIVIPVDITQSNGWIPMDSWKFIGETRSAEDEEKAETQLAFLQNASRI